MKQSTKSAKPAPDQTWAELAKVEGIAPSEVGAHIEREVRRSMEDREKPKGEKATKKQRPQVMQWPDRIPCAECMLIDISDYEDEAEEKGLQQLKKSWSEIELEIFNTWFAIQTWRANQQGLRADLKEYVGRYYNREPELMVDHKCECGDD